MEIHPLQEVANQYQQTNRSIHEQRLNLSPVKQQRLIAALEENCLPQHRYYRYKFYYDNCATRPRDMITDACGYSLTMPSHLRLTGKSYRDLINAYLTDQPWYQLGMNLTLGKPADEQTNGWQAMYSPDQLAGQLRQATIRLPDGQIIPLVKSEQILLAARKHVRKPVPFIANPNVVFTLLCLLMAGITLGRYGRYRQADRYIDRLLFSVSGFMGWILLLLWLIRDDGVTAWNPTVLYFMPLHLPLVYWATQASTPLKQRTLYFGLTALFTLLGMCLSKIPGLFAIVYPLMLLIRCLVNCQPVLADHRIQSGGIISGETKLP